MMCGRLRWDVVLRAAHRAVCTCSGEWIPMTEELLHYQCEGHPPNSPEAPRSDLVRAALRRALLLGCGKEISVFIYGPTNAAKTHLLQPLVAIFGDRAFVRPVGKGNFPLQDLPGKKVVVLRDLRAATCPA